MTTVLLYVAGSLLAFALVQRRLATTWVTGPMIFITLGLLAKVVAGDVGVFGSEDWTRLVEVVFQGALVLVLFSDASALHFSSWRRDASLPARLLGIGLPLAIGLGTAAAALVLTDLSIWEAAIVGAILAPTDAALGQAVISNPRVPARIRHTLDIESGLNDGIVLPFLLVFVGLEEQSEGVGVVETFLSEIGIGVLVGAAVGLVGGWLMVRAGRSDWMGVEWGNVAVVVIAGLCFLGADAAGGSGFIAAFVGGLAFGNVAGAERVERYEVLGIGVGDAMTQISFLGFGALILQPSLDEFTWRILLVALLALTAVRMVPTAVACIGTGLRWPSVLYLGWFGPRGLATVVFAALVVTEAQLPGETTIVAVAASTVTLSAFAHGISAVPGSRRYAEWCESLEEGEALVEMEQTGPRRQRRRTMLPTLR